jgi:peptidoglycan glycosyltransferase
MPRSGNAGLEKMMIMNENKDPRKSAFRIIYIFLGLFVLMMGYFIYFIVFKSEDVINSANNKRQEVLAERVVRGNILSADGKVLAKTVTDQEGKETREYPYGKIFSHVVGRFDKGRTGIEEAENIRLLTSNINSLQVAYADLVGKKSPGDNVVTTLDSELQQVAYDALGNYRGSVVVMEPSTGKILAMVSKPSYDPNEINAIWDDLVKDKDETSPLINRATQGLYPPGSTFKIISTLEYLRENPSTYKKYEYDCDGSIEYDGMIIHCYNNKKHGHLNLAKSFSKSCNTSFASIGESLDIESFFTLCEGFFFNQKLPIEMESNPSRYSLKKGSSSMEELMQTAIGQGNTLITPLHNAMITAAVANDGVMMKPYVVDHIENADEGTVRSYSPSSLAKPMTPEEAAYIGKMMRLVVTDGTGTKLKDMKQKAAGKTGSADNSNGKAHAWFVGYAPYDDPQLVVSIIVENVGTGSDYAVPIAKKIFQAYFK